MIERGIRKGSTSVLLIMSEDRDIYNKVHKKVLLIAFIQTFFCLLYQGLYQFESGTKQDCLHYRHSKFLLSSSSSFIPSESYPYGQFGNCVCHVSLVTYVTLSSAAPSLPFIIIREF